MGGGEAFRGMIVVRKDSGLNRLSDLKGRKVSYPAPSALAATMMPQYYMQTHGLDVNRDITNMYASSQASAIMNVFHGFTAAGTASHMSWLKYQAQYPGQANELKVNWQTEALPGSAFTVRGNVPEDVTARVAEALFSMHDTEKGRKLLEAIPLSHFEPATAETYEPVRNFLSSFSRAVRPVEE
jgi:phosphonate transport system substrate-binding protein